MHSILERGVPMAEHPTDIGVGPSPSWDGARLFLEIVRCGSLRSASEAMRVPLNTLRKRLEEFETQLGAVLLTRHVDGVRLTSDGERVQAAAELMESASYNLIRARGQKTDAMAGELRLAITEGLGTFWIAPRMVELQRAYPNLLINVHCATTPADVLRAEADVAVQLVRPQAKDVRVVRLGRLHAMFFASREYIGNFGMPKTVAEMINHRLVLLKSEQIRTDESFSELFPGIPQANMVSMRTNVSSMHYWSIAKGGGIGMLPTYAQAIGAHVVPVNVNYHTSHDIWLTYHVDASKVARVRRLIDWLVAAFSPKHFPWFGDEFIHPDDLPLTMNGEPVRDMFASFVASETKERISDNIALQTNKIPRLPSREVLR